MSSEADPKVIEKEAAVAGRSRGGQPQLGSRELQGDGLF